MNPATRTASTFLSLTSWRSPFSDPWITFIPVSFRLPSSQRRSRRVDGRAKGVPHRSALRDWAAKFAGALADLEERAAGRNKRIVARSRDVADLLRFRVVYGASRGFGGVVRLLSERNRRHRVAPLTVTRPRQLGWKSRLLNGFRGRSAMAEGAQRKRHETTMESASPKKSSVGSSSAERCALGDCLGTTRRLWSIRRPALQKRRPAVWHCCCPRNAGHGVAHHRRSSAAPASEGEL